MDRGDKVALLKSEAKRRPNIAALLDRIVDVSDAEIENAQVPLKWFREALYMARDRAKHEERMRVIAAKMGPLTVIDTGANSKRGSRLLYRGPNFFAKSDSGFEVEVRTNDWFFCPEGEIGAWLQHSYFACVPAQVYEHFTVMVEDETRYDYVCAWAEELSRRY